MVFESAFWGSSLPFALDELAVKDRSLEGAIHVTCSDQWQCMRIPASILGISERLTVFIVGASVLPFDVEDFPVLGLLETCKVFSVLFNTGSMIRKLRTR